MKKFWETCLVKPWDGKLRREYYKILSGISVLFTLLSVKPVEETIAGCVSGDTVWKWMFLLYIVFLAASYVILWIYANRKREVKLNINGNPVEIKKGNILEEADDVWKVINANEYFDTELGGKESLVSRASLQGQYLTKFYAAGTQELDQRISSQLASVTGKKKKARKRGKETQYPLGTVFCDRKDGRRYLLTAFSKMDSSNRAYLGMKDYVNFLMNFWDEIDKVYDGHAVAVSLFGTGIARLWDNSVTHQELLELVLWSLKNSRIQLAYGAGIKIILYGEAVEKVRLYGLEP